METPSPLRGAIVAMTRDNVIGLNGDLPWHYSADLKRFKRLTTDHTIIMGRLTWESIGSRPLPNRRNIVITSRPQSGVECFSAIDDAVSACVDQDIWFIGGGQIYRAAFPLLNLIDVTWVPDQVLDPAAVTFPAIDPLVWNEVKTSPLDDDERLTNSIYLRA